VAERLTVELEKPLPFGEMIIVDRTYISVRVTLSDGTVGVARTLDRGFDLSAVIADIVRPSFEGKGIEDPAQIWSAALRSASPSLSAGAGLRALSIVDIAFRNAIRLCMQLPERPVNSDAPVFVIVGYPPDSTPDEVAAETHRAIEAGAAGVKLPRSTTVETTRARLKAAVGVAGGCRVALDLAWSCASPDAAAHIVDGFELAWLEDPFPPGNVAALKALRSTLSFPLASGDEDATLYSPDVLIDSEAVDIVRLDATCQGGVTRMIAFAQKYAEQEVAVSWHMNSQIHSRLARELGLNTVSIEVSGPGAGVDPLEERGFEGIEASPLGGSGLSAETHRI
jgi:L-alanine-DL-glutamate epimerase-like enolase superfamily enzyme